jgi:hypothetical protein
MVVIKQGKKLGSTAKPGVFARYLRVSGAIGKGVLVILFLLTALTYMATAPRSVTAHIPGFVKTISLACSSSLRADITRLQEVAQDCAAHTTTISDAFGLYSIVVTEVFPEVEPDELPLFESRATLRAADFTILPSRLGSSLLIPTQGGLAATQTDAPGAGGEDALRVVRLDYTGIAIRPSLPYPVLYQDKAGQVTSVIPIGNTFFTIDYQNAEIFSGVAMWPLLKSHLTDLVATLRVE